MLLEPDDQTSCRDGKQGGPAIVRIAKALVSRRALPYIYTGSFRVERGSVRLGTQKKNVALNVEASFPSLVPSPHQIRESRNESNRPVHLKTTTDQHLFSLEVAW